MMNFADPMCVPAALVAGVLLGGLLSWPIAYLRGKTDAFLDMTRQDCARIERWNSLIRTAPTDLGD